MYTEIFHYQILIKFVLILVSLDLSKKCHATKVTAAHHRFK